MKYYVIIAFLLLFFSSCNNSIEQKDLYGKWNYVKVVNADPEDITSDEELKQASPAIIFTEINDLIIEWGGKQLSKGKYKLDSKMIRYTESLEGGRTREFPFLIRKLSDNELVFQTMEKNYTLVTAIRKR
ncbi:hypothetical protein [Daejeonella sp.]|uniref:hypothetical protein n=1 Tax=Daejeonella sp. TaxID=2805397 RepID=UPI0027291590|nr:hypothetical protein [Daejeonella sp.]MDO8992964.1 hypothetical protein [Daejeonella sp.]MDP2415280.1 hypothetical protein [Daejeonella sp.]